MGVDSRLAVSLRSPRQRAMCPRAHKAGMHIGGEEARDLGPEVRVG